MAKCLDCDCVYAVYGGSKGSSCPKCRSRNVETPEDDEPKIETRTESNQLTEAKKLVESGESFLNFIKERPQLLETEEFEPNLLAHRDILEKGRQALELRVRLDNDITDFDSHVVIRQLFDIDHAYFDLLQKMEADK